MAPVLVLVTPAQAATTTAALWHMDSDPMADSSVNGNDGTTTDVTVIPDGASGNGYRFAGPNSHVTVPDSASLNPGTADFSYTLHVRFTVVPNATVGDYDLIRKGLAGTTGGEWKMEILANSTRTAGNPFCLFKDNAGHTDSIRGSQDLADGTWHTVTCAKSSSANTLVVDGVSRISTPAAPLGSITNSAPVIVGQKWGGGDQYTGDMDEVSIQTSSAGGAPPTVTTTSPTSGATGVSTSTTVTATFNEPVANANSSTFTLKANGTAVTATVTFDGGTNTATLQPSAALAAGTTYTATLTSGITDTSGNPLTATSWSFTTAGTPDTTPPTVAGKSPPPSATNVVTSTNVTATFSEPVQLVSGTTFKLKLAGTTTAVSSTVTYDSATMTATLQPDAALTAGTKYTATLTSGIEDLARNFLSTTTWSFTAAGSPPDTTPPTFTSGTPAGNTTSIGLATNVTATFSEKVQGVDGTSLTVTPTGGGTPLAAAYTSNASGTKWTLNPTVNLAKDTQYTVTLTGDITDVAGNPLRSAPLTWTFLTGPAPTVSAKSPAPGAVGVAVTSTVTATFTEPVQNVMPSTFTLTSAAGSVQATVTRSGNTNKWILDPAARLQPATTYTVTLVGGGGGEITDLAGNPLKTATWTFTTS